MKKRIARKPISVKITLFSLLLTLFLIAGCGGGSDSGAPSEQTPFIGGTTGLSVNFVEGAPPEEVTDASNFPFGISLQVENLGESDLHPGAGEGYVKLTGMNPVDFGVPIGQAGPASFLKSPITFDGLLVGARKNYDGTVIPGGQTIVNFPFDPSGQMNQFVYVPNLHGNTAVKVRADACYNYQTKSSTKICVKEDLLSPTERLDVCELSDVKDPQNSGAPIHITEVKEVPIGEQKIQVTFKVEHIGEQTNTFFTHNTECNDKITNPEKYFVYVDVISDINGERADCSGLVAPAGEDRDGAFADGKQHAGFTRLFRGASRIVSCTFDLAHIDSDFEELFEVVLSYRYLTSIEKSFLVKDVSIGQSDHEI